MGKGVDKERVQGDVGGVCEEGGGGGGRDSGCGGVDATCSEKLMSVVNLFNLNFQQHRKPATVTQWENGKGGSGRSVGRGVEMGHGITTTASYGGWFHQVLGDQLREEGLEEGSEHGKFLGHWLFWLKPDLGLGAGGLGHRRQGAVKGKGCQAGARVSGGNPLWDELFQLQQVSVTLVHQNRAHHLPAVPRLALALTVHAQGSALFVWALCGARRCWCVARACGGILCWNWRGVHLDSRQVRLRPQHRRLQWGSSLHHGSCFRVARAERTVFGSCAHFPVPHRAALHSEGSRGRSGGRLPHCAPVW